MGKKTKPIKILVLEDSPVDFRLIEELLSKDKLPSFLIENKERLSTGLERLREGNIDVILLDLGLPDSSGIETFLQVFAEAPNIPVIILTGIEDDKFALEAVHRGAQDYLFKGHIEPGNMVRAIRYAIERKKIEIELKEANENLEAEIAERNRAEEALQNLAHDLGERVKELNCLYSISDLIEKQDTLEEIFQGTVKLIPTGWQYPEITCARLTLEGQKFKTENFRETTWKQRSDIAVCGHPVGAIEVAYLEEKPALDEGPFLKEERNLINAIAGRLGRIIERVRAREKIKASLAEKEVLLKEIHHRVRNNLQVINSLFSLQSRFIHDEESLAIFEKCKNRVNSIALVHEKLYESKDLANINFGDYIRTLINQLLNSYSAGLSAITLNINASEVFLRVNKAIPCALIINELVTNSMKYAFPKGQKGEIRIDLKSDSRGKVILIAADNGVGLPHDFDINDSKTLGMQIVNALVTQLHGSVKIGRGRSRGAKFTIEFQINND